ncbi:aminopeptidase N [Streptomyces sp. SAI-208]|uniref:aminopeptidase N n=1 Tax=unclassified Streptomyces TaxID=2593676 RepID=UPI0024733564|nr:MULTISPECIES: aminopeptidase N [unclassified Streptomyces]MDH6519768.1 aminopeptidase N [Streptomyces sp. SAI-090]MDH6551977.1 aminopeptidase N [Streptomyces sp. SAI-041]MDH6583963.1 aminopeptidase N [Streptomyces sp. SAI-133]MDH6610746.1 aminopeptidase N [Streptomyces sp. SAI-208]MDH6616139.1 aminopeptidase N [Streptomyces sp. SAI-135]
MSVLTRDEAQTRAKLLDVHRYTIALDLTTGDETFASQTVIRFTARTEADTFVELKPAELREATLDGRPLDPGTLEENRLPLTGLTAGEHELRIDADMRYSRTGEGMHRFTDPTDGETYVYTQLFLDDVQRVFAAFDQPDLKAVFDLSVKAPEGWSVLANGITTDLGDGHWQATPTPLISTYLVAVAAGPWHSVRTEHRGLPFGIHCRRSLAPYLDPDADEIFEITKQCYDRYHEKFEEPYPFDSYDQAFVPEFNAGAMENPGLVTFRDEFVYRSAVTDTERQTRAMVIAHEMAHMWFGDLVTLRWWDDIWLNESFAEYMGYQTLTEATRFTDTWVDFGVMRKGWGYDADQRPSTHPVAPDAVDDTASALLNFDGISYAKGASALRQLVHWLGEKDFLAGINTHFARHKFANAALADFIDSLASATERDVHAWADSWLRTTGVDTLRPVVTRGEEGTYTLQVEHKGSRPHRVNVGLYDLDVADEGRHLVLRDRLDLDVPQSTPQPIGKRPTLLLLNDSDLTYAKVRFDPESFKAVTECLSGLPSPLTRAVVWNALRDAVRDGELPPTAYLDAARAHLPHETDLALVQGVLAFASTYVADRYATPEERPAALTTLSSLCRDLIRRTEDGDNPGLRLIAVRHCIDVAAHPDTIAAWLADGTVPGGPELDPELRWRVLARLAVLGATDEAAITAELARDPSAAGQEGAARCRAALPTEEAKAQAWEAMFTRDDLSNYLFTATAQGFWQPEQTELVRQYVPRYYEDAVALAARRGPAIADAAGRWAFPHHAIDEDNLRLGQTCLRDADPIPALRRKLVDQLDDLGRALRVRQP